MKELKLWARTRNSEIREFINIIGKMPEKESGITKEGELIIKLGENGYPKSNFKLKIDEARALTGLLNKFIEKHDEQIINLHNDKEETYENYEAPRPEMFNVFNEEPKPKVQDKPEIEWY